MKVVEQAEAQFQRQVLALIDLPGPSPRARLFRVLQAAFRLWKTIPVLQIFTLGDYETLARRLSTGSFQTHLVSDHAFIELLIARCQDVGINITASPSQLGNLLYVMFFASMHEDDFGPARLGGAIDQLLEMIAAVCLGELELHHVASEHPIE